MSRNNGNGQVLEMAVAEATVEGVTAAPRGLTFVLAPAGDAGQTGLPLAALVESVLFVADEPVAVTDLARVLEADRKAVEVALAELATTWSGRGLQLQRTAGRVQMVTAPEAAEVIGRFLGLELSSRLSRPALEVLSIIAYRQPATRPEIDDLRGVDSDAALRTLLSRGLVVEVGRRETVGRPVEFGTTFRFLEYFGLASLADLPAIQSLDDEGLGAALVAEAGVEVAADHAGG